MSAIGVQVGRAIVSVCATETSRSAEFKRFTREAANEMKKGGADGISMMVDRMKMQVIVCVAKIIVAHKISMDLI